MGLWIARGLLAVQGGRVWAENCPDGGARFTLVVPEVRRRTPSGAVMTAGARILLVDDEPAHPALGRPAAARSWLRGDVAGTGAEALRLAADHPPDLIVLDLGLPDIEGTEVCRRMRRTSKVPIIVLSARGNEADKVQALDVGADDYVTKPFGPEELLARIRVALRRTAADEAVESGVLEAGDLSIDYDRRRVIRDGLEIRLTPKEFELLSLLARNHDRVLTHRAILKAIWGANAVEQPEHLWTLVGQLRKKIEPDPGHAALSRQRAVGRLSVLHRRAAGLTGTVTAACRAG